MTLNINYEELYINTLYHYLAEIYVINQKDLSNKEKKIREYSDKIKSKYNKDKKNEINKINELIQLIQLNETNGFENFNNKFQTEIK